MGDARRRREFEKGIAEAIARWKEVNTVMELKIVFAGNAALIGEYGYGILSKPRAIALGVDPQGRQVMALQNLIGEPESVEILNPFMVYDVKDEKIINLYIQATTNIVPAKDLSNVRLIKPGNN